MDGGRLESEREILAGVRAAGGRTKGDQLWGLSRAGLIGALKQDYPRGVSGSETYFPPGTLARVLAIGRVYGWKRWDPGLVGWALWYAGYSEFDERFWRDPLLHHAQWWDQKIRAIEKIFFSRHGAELSESGFNAISEFNDLRTRNAVFRGMRKRLGKEKYFDAGLTDILLIAVGRFRGLTADGSSELEMDRRILDASIGIDVMSSNRREAKIQILGNIEKPLITLSKQLKKAKLVDILSSTDNRQLAKARDEIRAIAEVCTYGRDPLEHIFGRYALGFRIFAQITKHAGPRLQAHLILLWLVLKRVPGMQERADEIIRTLPQVRQMYANYRLARHLSETDSQLSGVINRRRLRKEVLGELAESNQRS